MPQPALPLAPAEPLADRGRVLAQSARAVAAPNSPIVAMNQSEGFESISASETTWPLEGPTERRTRSSLGSSRDEEEDDGGDEEASAEEESDAAANDDER